MTETAEITATRSGRIQKTDPSVRTTSLWSSSDARNRHPGSSPGRHARSSSATLLGFFGSWTIQTVKLYLSSLAMDIDDDTQLMESDQNAPGTCWTKNERPTQHLKLDIGDSLLSSIRLMLAWYRYDSTQIRSSDRQSKYEELKTAQKSVGKNSNEVPTELPLRTLSVGRKKLIRTAECDIFARFYYKVEKVVCQMRMGALSRRVVIPFSHITALHVCFDHRGFDTLKIEAKLSFKSLSADNTLPGKFPDWKVEDHKDVYSFPESKFVFLEIEKGVLEKGFAKLLYTDPTLQRVVNFSRGSFSDQCIHHGRLNAPMMQTNMYALHALSSNIVFPSTEG